MKSSTTPDFWICYRALPPEIKNKARAAYRLWRENPRHPSLRFKKAGGVWSMRIGAEFRALALLHNNTFYWFWIGAHDEYERLIGGS
ncbi:MAG: hypothetical protein HYY11_10035 [Candidatus Methylomirabilis oxyfera]|nr:hypothetical protein [Candidatus Methylomirabilis oxyfera]